MHIVKKIVAGFAASTALAAGMSAGLTATAHADPPHQRAMNAHRLLQAKDLTQVFPKYTSVRTNVLATPNRHLSSCTGKLDLSDIVAVRKSTYGVLRQNHKHTVQIKITQQAARDTFKDGDARPAFKTLKHAFNQCQAQMINGLIYMPVVNVKTPFYAHAAYYPLRTDDFAILGAVIIATNQDHLNVLRISTPHAMTEKQLTQLTKLAVKRVR